VTPLGFSNNGFKFFLNKFLVSKYGISIGILQKDVDSRTYIHPKIDGFRRTY